jgi:hypothetical protein
MSDKFILAVALVVFGMGWCAHALARWSAERTRRPEIGDVVARMGTRAFWVGRNG